MINWFKNGLCHQRAQRWTLARMNLPRQIQVSMDGIQSSFQVSAPVTAGEVEKAESLLIGTGSYVTVELDSQRLPPWSQLHADVLYQLVVHDKRQARPTSAPFIACGLPSGLDFPVDMGASIGLGDTHVWKSMKLLLDFCSVKGALDLPFTLYPFRATQFLSLGLPPAVIHNWRTRFQASDARIMLVFEHAGHWIFLAGHLDCAIHWSIFDSLPLDPQLDQLPVVKAMALKLSHLLGYERGTCTLAITCLQHFPHTCGTLALYHMALQLQVQDFLPFHDELLLHAFFQGLSFSVNSFAAQGPSSTDPLQQLLVNKGVPSARVAERAQQVRDTLGASSVNQILKSSNPWSALKSAASKPGKMFRLVTETELKDYYDVHGVC
eukprot:s772_g15.t1